MPLRCEPVNGSHLVIMPMPQMAKCFYQYFFFVKAIDHLGFFSPILSSINGGRTSSMLTMKNLTWLDKYPSFNVNSFNLSSPLENRTSYRKFNRFMKNL